MEGAYHLIGKVAAVSAINEGAPHHGSPSKDCESRFGETQIRLWALTLARSGAAGFSAAKNSRN